MSSFGTITRRTFIAVGGSAAILGTGLFSTRMVCGRRSKTNSAGKELLDILPHEEAKSIGKHLLTGNPNWADKTWLEAELLSNIHWKTPQDLAERVNQQCREDFARQRVVTLHGWLLSRTEAQLCTLYALSEAPV